jgi:hypothetical protein
MFVEWCLGGRIFDDFDDSPICWADKEFFTFWNVAVRGAEKVEEIKEHTQDYGSQKCYKEEFETRFQGFEILVHGERGSKIYFQYKKSVFKNKKFSNRGF